MKKFIRENGLHAGLESKRPSATRATLVSKTTDKAALAAFVHDNGLDAIHTPVPQQTNKCHSSEHAYIHLNPFFAS